MADLGVSIGLVACIVLFCEAMRRAAKRHCSEDYRIYLVEAVSTFQLCACTHELKLLAEMGSVELHIALTMSYTMTIVHISTFSGASCNPVSVLESLCRGTTSARGAAVLISGQFGAAIIAQFSAAAVWSLGLSDLHSRYGKLGYRCFDPMGGTLLQAAGVELACAFCLQATVMHLHKLNARLRIHAVAAVIISLCYTGGHISGTVFNAVLAFSIQFPCSGHTYPEYCFVYWLGPLLGMTSCIMLFEKIIPFLSGKSTIGKTTGTLSLSKKTL
ncbi:aquaporin-11-like [Gadus macrocephalus]|uniref:aquaporin-11-like n=1 Tax=Gadus macrocephalus TaxID=80720 RepID=UPI0028CBA533|nr:aquaporin-11-like [Gadus macrocephalus]